MVIERSIAAGLAFQFIVKIKYNFGKRHFKYQLNTGSSKVALLDGHASFPEAQRHYIADILWFGNDLCPDERLFNPLCFYRIRELRGVIYNNLFSFGGIGYKTYVGYRGNYRLVEFSFQTLLDDLHVQQAQKATAETESQSL